MSPNQHYKALVLFTTLVVVETVKVPESVIGSFHLTRVADHAFPDGPGAVPRLGGDRRARERVP